jgi:hypothetical protein
MEVIHSAYHIEIAIQIENFIFRVLFIYYLIHKRSVAELT